MQVSSLSFLAVLTSSIIQFTICPAAEPSKSQRPDEGNFIADTTTMIRMVVRMESPEIKKGEFASLPKTIWRSGNKYMRCDELPDSLNGIHQRMVFAEPDAWMVNLITKSGQHFVDRGPTFNTRCPDFSELLDSTVSNLEMGKELMFFRQSHAEQLPDDSSGSAGCSVWHLSFFGGVLQLYVRKDTHLPARIVWDHPDQTKATLIFDEYVPNLPLDRTLFAPPTGVTIKD